MGAWQFGELVAFVVVGGGLVILLDIGMRRAARQRAGRSDRPSARLPSVRALSRDGSRPRVE